LHIADRVRVVWEMSTPYETFTAEWSSSIEEARKTKSRGLMLSGNVDLSALAALSGLKGLSLSNCSQPLDDVIHAVAGLRLEYLGLRSPKLKKLPEALRELKTLEQLDLEGGFATISDAEVTLLGAMPALVGLTLKKSLKTVPPALAKLTRLRALDLSFNRLSELPDLSALEHLEQLSLGGNPLQAFPEWVFALEELRHLSFGAQRKSPAPPAVPSGIGRLSKLERAWLDGVASLPDDVGALAALKELRLAGVEDLPASIGRLKNLEVLQVARLGTKATLRSLPEELGQLSSLKELTVWGTFKKFPALAGLRALEELRICGSLKVLPSVEKLTSLKTLGVMELGVSALPELAGLTSLTALYANGNALTELPESIGTLTSLEVLEVARNRLKALPASVARCTKLSQLSVDEPVTLPPALLKAEKQGRLSVTR
jgi:leucine-rich repeat protein SHOC2